VGQVVAEFFEIVRTQDFAGRAVGSAGHDEGC
jgi:hypothetical protein